MNVCMVQMRISAGKRSGNLASAIRWLDQAAELNPSPDLIVLPERTDLGGGKGTDNAAFIEPRGGTFVESLAERARVLGVYVAAGVTDTDGERIYNSSVLIDPDGDTILHHRRISGGASAGDAVSRGSWLGLRDTTLGSIGLLTGSDLWQEALADSLLLMGAGLIVVAGGGGGCGHRGPTKSRADPGALSRRCKRSGTAIVATAAAEPEVPGRGASGPYSFCMDGGGVLVAAAESGQEMLVQARVIVG